MTPADERMVALLAKWRKSLELHARYTDLTDDQYWLVQPWPQHQRPNRWIIDLASQRLTELQRIFQTRIAAGDPSLSEALELMSFLANLVGSQHVQRFIPMAEPEQQRPIESLTVQKSARTAPSPSAEPVREVPAPAVAAAPANPDAATDGSMPAREQDVVRDAIRLLSWGREWHELPHAIARMAGRPNSAAVRRILRTHRESIEQKVGDQVVSR